MRVIHTSDWHLGRIFHGVHLTDDQEHVLRQFVDLVADTKPDAVLIAGDIYDRAVPPPEAVALLDDVLSSITLKLKIPVVMIAGNHDSPERLGFASRVMAERGLHVFGPLSKGIEPVQLEDKSGLVNLYCLPYAEPPVVRQVFDQEVGDHNGIFKLLLDETKKKHPSGRRSILMTHAFVAGGEESESERPLSVGGSGMVDASLFSDFNYVALGHLHRPQKAGFEHVQYSGSLMKYSFSEADHKKVINIVEMDGQGEVKLEKVSLLPRRDVRRLEGYLSEIIAGAAGDNGKNDYLMVTLKDKQAILDAMGKLREVYPNVLHIERPMLNGDGKMAGNQADHRKVDDAQLFASFFSQVTNENLSEDEKRAYEKVVQEMIHAEREAVV
ncbi:MAG: exonuclease SbcCD subunit D [Candidatus Obscuribacterales bacterium]|nr:exonuclease SbcCD subunit D [Candidatus Obscuribacterales bacterium]